MECQRVICGAQGNNNKEQNNNNQTPTEIDTEKHRKKNYQPGTVFVLGSNFL